MPVKKDTIMSDVDDVISEDNDYLEDEEDAT